MDYRNPSPLLLSVAILFLSVALLSLAFVVVRASALRSCIEVAHKSVELSPAQYFGQVDYCLAM